MATVYLAHDLRHDRRVALKILRPELAALIGGERFLHEIRTTANLQHPHILPLHDSGEAAGSVFYVMPFVEGPTLRERLRIEKQLPVDEAVRITREVASALDYAHRHGVVHRDIKPENILLHDGQALVADFGIALAVSRSDGGTRMTETGMSLGTPHYMAPEQAMGEREITARADVYALGCVLYECLAGEPPFTGPSAQAIIARVLTDQPRPLRAQRRTIPPHVEAAALTALEKLPADRFATAAALGEALANPAYHATTAADAASGAAAAPANARELRRWRALTFIFLGTTLATVAAWAALRTPSDGDAEGAPVIAVTLRDSVGYNTHPVVARTGAIAWPDRGGIHLLAPGAVVPMVVPQTQGMDARTALFAPAMAFAPDGRTLAYVVRPPTAGPTARFQIRAVPVAGGVPQVISGDFRAHDFALIQTLRWGADGYLYIGASDRESRTAALVRVPETGGAADTLLTLVNQIILSSAFMPGGSKLALGLSNELLADTRVVLLDLVTRDTTLLLDGVRSPEWSPTGHLLSVRANGTLVALPMDRRSGAVLGPAVPVGDSVSGSSLQANFSLSGSGTLVYVRGPTIGTRNVPLALLDVVDGRVEQLPLPPTDHPDGDLSPDGRRVVYTRHERIWIYDLDLGTHRELPLATQWHHNPIWSFDGRHLAFSGQTAEDPRADIWVIADSTGAVARRVASLPSSNSYPSEWLGDGTILFVTAPTNLDVYRIRLDGAAESTPVLSADWIETWPRVSPDGRWLAYVSDEDGAEAVYVRQWPSLTGKVRVSEAIGSNSEPVWSPDGRSIYFFAAGDRDLMAADVDGRTESFRVTGIRVIHRGTTGYTRAMHPDGRRVFGFLLNLSDTSGTGTVPRLIVVTNWQRVLEERLGIARR